MKKIIVPIDFSKSSTHAVAYAKTFAKILQAEIQVVYVWFPDLDVDDPKDFMQTKTEEERKQALHEFLQDNGLPISAGKIDIGFPAIVINELSKAEDTAMIVMGKKGHGNVIEKVFGSVSSIVAKEAACPVLLVPDEAPPKGHFKNVMVAAGVEATDEKSLNHILELTKSFKATVHFVHIKKGADDKEGLMIEDKLLDNLLKDEKPSIAFNLVDIPYKNIIGGLNQYAEENKVDLTIMVSRHRKWWGDMFHKSKTRLAALETEIPLMVIHLDDH